MRWQGIVVRAFGGGHVVADALKRDLRGNRHRESQRARKHVETAFRGQRKSPFLMGGFHAFWIAHFATIPEARRREGDKVSQSNCFRASATSRHSSRSACDSETDCGRGIVASATARLASNLALALFNSSKAGLGVRDSGSGIDSRILQSLLPQHPTPMLRQVRIEYEGALYHVMARARLFHSKRFCETRRQAAEGLMAQSSRSAGQGRCGQSRALRAMRVLRSRARLVLRLRFLDRVRSSSKIASRTQWL